MLTSKWNEAYSIFVKSLQNCNRKPIYRICFSAFFATLIQFDSIKCDVREEEKKKPVLCTTVGYLILLLILTSTHTQIGTCWACRSSQLPVQQTVLHICSQFHIPHIPYLKMTVRQYRKYWRHVFRINKIRIIKTTFSSVSCLESQYYLYFICLLNIQLCNVQQSIEPFFYI